MLPAFVPNPLASIETPDSAGYIDVAFEITKYGEGKSVEILDTSTNTTDAARLHLRDVIKDPSRVVVRYYVND